MAACHPALWAGVHGPAACSLHLVQTVLQLALKLPCWHEGTEAQCISQHCTGLLLGSNVHARQAARAAL